MKIRFTSKVAMFQQACYNQQTLVLQGKIPTPQNLGHFRNHCFNPSPNCIKLCVKLSMLWLLVVK